MMAKIELIGGHIGNLYVNYRDGQSRINRRPINWIYCHLYRLPEFEIRIYANL